MPEWPRLREFHILLLPPGFWLLLFFGIPLVIVLNFSVSVQDIYGGIVGGFTWEHYQRVFDPLYLGIFWQSIKVSALTTGIVLLLAYPTAYYLTFAPRRMRMLLLFLIILPFWTNFLVRMYSFMCILGADGVINRIFLSTGLISEPLPLLHSTFAVYVGFVYGNLPYMILPLFAALDRMDTSLLEASMDLGAGALRTFWHVTLPYSLSGMVAGMIFVFIPTLGNFVVPEILGGTNDVMIGNVINRQFLESRNWPLGSALCSLMVVVLLVVISIYLRFYDPMKKKRLAAA